MLVVSLLILALLAGADAFAGMRALPVAGLRRSGVASRHTPNVAAILPHKRDLAIRSTTNELVGEDAAAFSLGEQDLKQWGIFSVAVSGILSVLFYAWLYEGGPHLGDQFKDLMESLAGGDTTLAIVYMLGFFAVAHSGMASLRPRAEEIIGARAWRYAFALVSLPLAFSSIVYFINHRYDGVQLWDLRGAAGMHDFVWWSSMVSFLFLYPSTFNLLEVAAVTKPELHLWETGIARVTRHPQMVGQLVWCLAHTAYMGTSFTCATSAMLCAHHIFAVWNGDRRLQEKYGEKAELIKEQTSVVPFAAIISGKQQLPPDFYKEFLRPSYLTIIGGSVLAYQLHPFMQAGAALCKW
ncbi:NnrU protein-domain-containing protein [Ochromonadaceae sp. CCMP2298]|nr:NnrU protein-domain-containing protein [Ochromonadaceae sp. CCMP2298]